VNGLRLTPGRYAPALAATLGLSHPAARRRLRRFIELALSELGDLREEAIRAAEAA
jgi:hypothetical protein